MGPNSYNKAQLNILVSSQLIFPSSLIDSIIKLNGIHSNEKEILISQISSESSPLSGQQNRSSQNFKIDSLPVGTKELKWVIEPSEKIILLLFLSM